ncbi:hypothetical protein [Streptomyces sp. SID13031]|uniref:hypothetical protein n=1 Tax=Streptomyces sp. SID13031 TaxID=2706046 RepID=UPI0013C80F9C|nr:hypothetical protein [Streptomyces sp. SID13031]NEA37307.1 hypothetical protein [Streptomyces sp. SID13031]
MGKHNRVGGGRLPRLGPDAHVTRRNLYALCNDGVLLRWTVVKGKLLNKVSAPGFASMKPIVKLVRSTGWQGFEAMHAQKCGQLGTILLGIDRDTKSSYLYALGHANGKGTVIQSLGKVPAGYTFPGPVYFRWKGLGTPLTGE